MAPNQTQISFPEDHSRYSDQDLQIFKALLEKKLSSAEAQLTELKDALTGASENDTRDTMWSFKADDGCQNSTKDETTILAHKQEVFIQSLKNALVRIEKGTYGICVQTGQKIDRNRLLAVPNTTTCLVAKKAMADTMPPPDQGGFPSDL